MGSIIDRALDIINDHLKDQTSSFRVGSPLGMGQQAMARGGHVLEDDYPTHYLPHVGRQVMADGGMPEDPIAGALQTAREASSAPSIGHNMPPEPIEPIAPAAPAVKGFEGRVGMQPPRTLGSMFENVPEAAPWKGRAEEEAKLPRVQTLADAFNAAIERHTSLPYKERVASTKAAIEKLAPYVGMRKDGTLVPLLGKNAKLMKSETGYGDEKPVEVDGMGVETTGLALAPAFKMGNFQTCPNHASCKDECLGKTSGNYFKLGGGQDLSDFQGPRLNSLNKTIGMLQEPEAFAIRLYDEIMSAKREAEYNGNKLGVRLNVLSDLSPKILEPIIKNHPEVDFYDYTKMGYDPVAPNHHYTYSSTGVSDDEIHNPNSNWKKMRERLDRGDNVAMAFTDKDHLPEEIHDEETGKKYRVINGDTHDYRPLDKVPEGEDGVIVGLKNKKATGTVGSAHKESKGFFVKYDPQLKRDEKGKLVRGESPGLNKAGKPLLGETIPTNRTVVIKKQ